MDNDSHDNNGTEPMDVVSPDGEGLSEDVINEEREEELFNIKIVSDEAWLAELPEKERMWYESNLTAIDELDENKTIVCTACFKQTNHKVEGEVGRHPILGVVICKMCKNFYYDGAWTKDDAGKYEFCGWCANGGELLDCDSQK